MIVGVTGLGNTGSMALIDLLKEYDEVFFDEYLGEFSLCYFPDGLIDLETHVCTLPFRFQSSDVALDRFDRYTKWLFAPHKGERYKYNRELLSITEQFIKSITQLEWYGSWSYRIQNRGIVWSFIQKALFKCKRFLGESGEALYIGHISSRMRYSVRPDDFQENARQYIRNLIDATRKGKDGIPVLDMAFPGDNPESCFHFFEDPFAIVVDRDPRDLYVLSKKYIKADSLWIPTENVEQFILYYKNMRTKSNPISDYKRVLRIQYEDIVYNLESVESKVESFLGIQKHSEKGKYFKPEESINNTQLFRICPELKNDIVCIEAELSEWLYDFNTYGEVAHIKKAW